MPDDAIHANLTGAGANMPQDDIHAGLTGGNMPGGMPMISSPELEASVDRTPLQWDLPQGWSQQKGSGMRLATLKSATTETTIISLSGSAGGAASNIMRWMQQINVPPLAENELNSFLDSQERLTTASGLNALIVDLSQLQPEAPAQAPSIIAAIIDRQASQIFIKMTGTKEAVLKDREAFLGLVRSVKAPE
jgi:hypothetical protein